MPLIVERQRPEQSGQAIGQARFAHRLGNTRRAVQNLCRQTHQQPAGGIHISLQRDEVGKVTPRAI